MGAWAGIAAVVAVMAALVGALKLLERIAEPHPEILRKLLHVGMGLVVVTFPWVFETWWPVALLATGAAGGLAVMRYIPQLRDGMGSVIHSVRRPSLGEICFPVAVGVVFILAQGNWLLYVIPMLILTLADAVAALIGIAYGRIRYVTSEGLKSAEGSIMFFAVALMSVHVPLLLFTEVGRAQTLLVAAIIAVLSMLVEAISARGLDNLLIPVGAYAMLRWYLDATVEGLAIRLGVTAVLLVFALVWRRRTSLDDSALMASALFGYGAWMLGGWEWVVGPAVLFLLYVGLWPRETHKRGDNVWVVLSVVSGGLIWLMIATAAWDRQPLWLVGYAVVFGGHLAMIGISRIAGSRARVGAVTCVVLSLLGGWVLAVMQVVGVMWDGGGIEGRADRLILMAACLAGVAITGAGFGGLMPWMYGPRGSDAAIHTAGAALAIIGSLVAVAILAGTGF